MMHGMGSPTGIALILISLGIGYLVCEKADKEKGFLKQLGYWIGSIIIVASMLTALCGWYCKVAKKLSFGYGKYKSCCPMYMKHMKYMKK
jgi:hypothetical protein